MRAIMRRMWVGMLILGSALLLVAVIAQAIQFLEHHHVSPWVALVVLAGLFVSYSIGKLIEDISNEAKP